MLAGAVILRRGAADARSREIERQAVEPALGLIQRLVDARELFFRDDIRAHTRFDLRQAFVIGFLESREGVIELADDLLAGGFYLDR